MHMRKLQYPSWQKSHTKKMVLLRFQLVLPSNECVYNARLDALMTFQKHIVLSSIKNFVQSLYALCFVKNELQKGKERLREKESESENDLGPKTLTTSYLVVILNFQSQQVQLFYDLISNIKQIFYYYLQQIKMFRCAQENMLLLIHFISQ